MTILTDEITKALDEGYEIHFKKVDDYGPTVLDIRLSKNNKTFRVYEDFDLCRDSEDIAHDVDRAIRYLKIGFESKGE